MRNGYNECMWRTIRTVLHCGCWTRGSRRRGQSLVEILIAVGVGALLVTGAGMAIAPSLRTNTQAYRVQAGTGLAKELLENVRVWSESDWHNILNLATSSERYYLTTSSSPFVSVTGTESIVVATTTYTRSFSVDDVYRDASDLIVTSGGSYDPSTKKVSINYVWLNSATATITSYVTRNRNNFFWQSDWLGGSGQTGPVTSTNDMFASSTKITVSTSTGSITITL